jgi:hypothetical protein
MILDRIIGEIRLKLCSPPVAKRIRQKCLNKNARDENGAQSSSSKEMPEDTERYISDEELLFHTAYLELIIQHVFLIFPFWVVFELWYATSGPLNYRSRETVVCLNAHVFHEPVVQMN